MRSAYWRVVLVALLAAATGAVTGCANDQETINRVQPNAVDKGVFDGNWYYLQTVIDTPAGTPYTFVGDQSGIRKIRWEIEQDFLIARRSYDLIAGAEQEGPDELNDAKNTALAKFRITSHFDIRRDYNPATGEQTNVVSENTIDRPWFDREFMRVDWAENLVTDGDFMTIKQAIDGLQVESSYFVQKGVDAPLFDKDENGVVTYMDIVNKMFVKPTTVDIPGYGPIPTCLLNGHDLELCQDSEVSVRNSFLKVTERDFQPVLYTGDRMERFGFFVDERKGYSKDYGFIEGERYRFAQRHNLWKKSHRTSKDGKQISCVEDVDCNDNRGSVCDKAWGRAHRTFDVSGKPKGLCTIAYRDREIRPIVYYMSANHPQKLAADADSLADSWNGAFVETVSSLRENECVVHAGADCANERGRTDHQKIFHICTTPVAAGAPAACGKVGLSPRPGDLRYSQIVWVSSEESGGPLGYGPGHSDPETGETIMGNAFMYGAAVEKYSAYGRDLVKLLNGDLTVEELQSGDYINFWAQVARSGGTDQEHGDKHAIEMTPEILAQDVKSMDYRWAEGDIVKTAPRNIGEAKQTFDIIRNKLYANGAFGQGVDLGASRIKRLIGTDIEAMMVTPDMRLAAGLDPRDTTTGDDVMKSASPLRGMSLDSMRAIERARQMIVEKAGWYDAEFHDEGLVGLALEIQAQAGKAEGSISWYGRQYPVTDAAGKLNYEAVRQMVLHPMYHGLTLHEVGHSVGLRHNFSGSYDAVNYSSKYWDLRDDGDMKPRLWDPVSKKETAGRIREFQYSTVMDYGNNFIVSDSQGLGHYDMAAIKMGYGDLVEVFDGIPEAKRTPIVNLAAIQQIGWPILLDLASTGKIRAFTYTDWPTLAGGRANLQKRADVPYTQLTTVPALKAQGITDRLVDGQGRPAVPFMFCSDEQADLNPDCMRYDAGADPFESVQSVVDSYWYYYPFLNFRRQRLGFSVGPTVERIHSRYFEKVKRAHQIYALYRPIFTDSFNIPEGDPFWKDQNGMGAWTAAADLGFKLLKQVITTPEPGNYTQTTRADGQTLITAGGGGGGGLSTPAGTVDSLDGRFLETTWDQDAGYFWFDQLDRVGYFYDKVYAMMTLVDPTTYFINRDTAADIRRYQLSYSSSFGAEVNTLFRAVLAEDWVAIAPRLEAGKVVYPELDEMEKRSMTGVPMEPNVSFSVQLYAAVFGMAYIPQTYDQDFLNSSRVWIEGGAEEIELDPSMPLVSFRDPESGLTYSSASYPVTDTVGSVSRESGVGASLLAYANDLAEGAAGPDKIYGTTDDVLVARNAMRKFVDNIDIVRRLTWQLGFGAQP